MNKDRSKRFVAEIDTVIALERKDPSKSHQEADDILCALLLEEGYESVVNKYLQLTRWFE